MALPLLGLGARAAFSLAKNKKAREALTKSVGGFLKRRTDLTKTLKQGRNKSPSLKALTGFPGGAAIGAGTSTVIMDKKLREAKKIKKTNNTSVTKKPKRKPVKFR